MIYGRIPSRLLADWCRSLASSLNAGISLIEAMDRNGRRGRIELRGISRAVAGRLADGDDLGEAFEGVANKFPPIFLAMTRVASHTGHLPEVLRRLEDYFRFQVRMRQQFLAHAFWPAFQLIAAILVIALVIFIMGLVPQSKGPDALTFDPIGLGLRGGTGATIWLGGCFGSIAALLVLYWALRKFLGQGWLVDSLLLRIPALGRCLRSLALSRLCFAMNMTFSTGMSVIEAMRLSLEATDNHAFSSLVPQIERDLRSGETLPSTFAAHSVFPHEFLDSLATSAESGTVPETMLRMARHYNEEAEHGLSMLNTAVGFLVWCLVALMIIFFIFRMFSSYLGLLNQVQSW